MIKSYFYANGIFEVGALARQFISFIVCTFLTVSAQTRPFSIISIAVGFAFLPFVWLINSIWFFNEAFKKPEYNEQKLIKRCKYLCVRVPFR